MKFKAQFQGVPNGEIYPVQYEPGDECPPELLNAAIELGAVATKKGGDKNDNPPAETE
ncbi:hypothetical protein [Duganella sp. CY15W]|uniref:hypothetical protein n=1 Tax=Duganella sp. CY15W TaxID=2692172 RepID=UPI0019286A51|nr:hypothetical protein [Duganella sp. CY15W]